MEYHRFFLSLWVNPKRDRTNSCSFLHFFSLITVIVAPCDSLWGVCCLIFLHRLWWSWFYSSAGLYKLMSGLSFFFFKLLYAYDCAIEIYATVMIDCLLHHVDPELRVLYTEVAAFNRYWYTFIWNSSHFHNSSFGGHCRQRRSVSKMLL